MGSFNITAIAIYLACVNVIAFAAFGIDKSRAQRGAWRISEKALMTFAVAGGSIGALAGMHVFRHKTKKPLFTMGVPAILIVQVLLVGLVVFLARPQAEPEPEMQIATVEYVIDGDTIDVVVDGGAERIRLIGIDAPESASHDESLNTAEGALASDYLRSWLATGTTVYLQADAEDRDHYGRLLRYVWLERPNNAYDPAEVEAKMLNARIVVDGYADAMRYEPNTRYAAVFESLKDEAAAQGRGISYLWR